MLRQGLKLADQAVIGIVIMIRTGRRILLRMRVIVMPMGRRMIVTMMIVGVMIVGVGNFAAIDARAAVRQRVQTIPTKRNRSVEEERCTSNKTVDAGSHG
jgi:hypothetical protein